MPEHVGYGPRPAGYVDANTRKPGPYPPGVGRMTRPGVLPVLLALVMTLGVVLGVIYAVVTVINHLDALLVLFRGVPAVPLRFQWAIPQPLAAVILAIGLPLARRFRRPERLRTGVVLLALAFATFWPLQYLAARFDLPLREYEAVLHGLAFFISVCLLSGGLETMPGEQHATRRFLGVLARIALARAEVGGPDAREWEPSRAMAAIARGHRRSPRLGMQSTVYARDRLPDGLNRVVAEGTVTGDQAKALGFACAIRIRSDPCGVPEAQPGP